MTAAEITANIRDREGEAASLLEHFTGCRVEDIRSFRDVTAATSEPAAYAIYGIYSTCRELSAMLAPESENRRSGS